MKTFNVLFLVSGIAMWVMGVCLGVAIAGGWECVATTCVTLDQVSDAIDKVLTIDPTIGDNNE